MSAAAPASPSSILIRSVRMSCSLLGAKSGRNVNTSTRPAEEDHPFLALAPIDRAQWQLGALDPERPREEAPHLAPGHRKGRAATGLSNRIEAREEPAPGSQDCGHRADVLGAARGVDRTEARVLPHTVERVGVVAVEGEDVALLELRRDALRLRPGLGLGDRRRGEVEADGHVAAPDQVAHVVAAPAAGDRDAAGRKVRGLQERRERRRGPAELPSVAAAGVEIGPELGGAYAGHSSPSKSSMTEAAPAPRSSSAVRSEERRVGKECRSRWSPYH